MTVKEDSKRLADAGIGCCHSEGGSGLAQAFGEKSGKKRPRRTREGREKAMELEKYRDGLADCKDGL